MIRYISDLHLNHEHNLKFISSENDLWAKSGYKTGKYFSSMEEYNNTIINNWNSVLSPEDVTYILGDIGTKSVSNIVDILKKLNGHKILIVGNHDEKYLKNPEFINCFDQVINPNFNNVVLDSINGEDKELLLSHFPIWSHERFGYNVIHLHGHIHNSFMDNMCLHAARNCYNDYRKDHPSHDKVVQLIVYNVSAQMPYMDYTPRTLNEIMELSEKFYKKEL